MLSSYLFKIGMSKEDEQFYLISHFLRGHLRKSDVSSPSKRHKEMTFFVSGARLVINVQNSGLTSLVKKQTTPYAPMIISFRQRFPGRTGGIQP